MYQLKNEALTLEIDAHGAEMKSLKDNQTGQEYLWMGIRRSGNGHLRFCFRL